MTMMLWPANVRVERAQTMHARATLLGVPVEVSFRPVHDELERRADSGPETALRSYADLIALSQLPVDLPTPRRVIEADDLRRLLRTPRGAVDVDETTITRGAVAGVRVQSIVHEGTRWSTALERASRFAPYAQRTVVLPRRPRNAARVRTEAAYYGVGVRIGAADDEQWLAHPAPFRPESYSAASWFLDESVLAAVTGTA